MIFDALNLPAFWIFLQIYWSHDVKMMEIIYFMKVNNFLLLFVKQVMEN